MDNSNRITATQGGGSSAIGAGDWGEGWNPGFRQRVINKIIEMLMKRIPTRAPESRSSVEKLAIECEKKLFAASSSQADYLRRLSQKLRHIEAINGNGVGSSSSGVTGTANRTSDPGSRPQIQNQSKSISNQVAVNVSQAQKTLLHHNVPDTVPSKAQCPASLTFTPVLSNSTQTSSLNVVGQKLNMQKFLEFSENPSVGLRGATLSRFVDSQNQIQGPRQQHLSPNSQLSPNQQSQPSQQSIPQTYSVMQQAKMQSSPLSSLRQSQLSNAQQKEHSNLQENHLRLLRHQSQAQSNSHNHLGLQQQFMNKQGEVASASDMPVNQLICQQNSMRSTVQQLQNDLSNHMKQQQRLIAQTDVSGLQQPLQPSMKKQYQSSSRQSNLQELPNSLESGMVGSSKAPRSLLEQKNMANQQRQQPFPSQSILPETSTTPGPVAQTEHAEMPDWQEEIYQKINEMKKLYLPELVQIYKREHQLLQQQHDLHRQSLKSGQFERMRLRSMHQLIDFLQVPKSKISLEFKEILLSYQKSIVRVINENRTSRAPSVQHGLPPRQKQLPVQLQAHHKLQPQERSASKNLKTRFMNGVEVGGVSQQNYFSGHGSAFSDQQLISGASMPISSPLLRPVDFPRSAQHSSLQSDKCKLLVSPTNDGIASQSANVDHMTLSTAKPSSMSPTLMNTNKSILGSSSPINSGNIGQQQTDDALVLSPSISVETHGMSNSSLLAAKSSGPDAEQPIKCLIRAVKSVSPQALHSAVRDISSVVSINDRLAGPAPGTCSRASVAEDLLAMTKRRLSPEDDVLEDVSSGARKLKRHFNVVPLSVVSSSGGKDDSFAEQTEEESIGSSNIKRPKLEANYDLLEEIKETNRRLIDTVVCISDDVDLSVASATIEVGEGTIVKCSFTSLALDQDLRSELASLKMTPIQPLWLLLPKDYPNFSPIFLDKFQADIRNKGDELSVKARSRLDNALRMLPEPMLLQDIAVTWEQSVQAVILDYAQQRGGGCFSSKYGAWVKCC